MGVLIMFDLSCRSTWYNIQSWLLDAYRVVPEAAVVVIGNKADLRTNDRQVRVRGYPSRRDPVTYCEISAKAHYNIAVPFHLALQKIYSKAPMLRIVHLPLAGPPTIDMPDEARAHSITACSKQPVRYDDDDDF
eukprot:NODE_1453_length_598_cov_554.224044_g1159_i0.p1 GENE.NODE_1453_length_598_cov_554.224044_g1159_i0~~NODE_1453_length_598_cov_554.224044_g1159_i0.p1  ORF type:complete len:141 (-),score=20.05 NODE_1453_length_598_cov_554.224044_g1159_i0:175-576(-)